MIINVVVLCVVGVVGFLIGLRKRKPVAILLDKRETVRIIEQATIDYPITEFTLIDFVVVSGRLASNGYRPVEILNCFLPEKERVGECASRHVMAASRYSTRQEKF